MEQYWDTNWGAIPRPKRIIWKCDLLGDNSILITYTEDTSWLLRMRTKIFLGSKWEKLN